MPKIAGYEIVFREFPDEITLAFNFSECPCRCEGCHSKYLWWDTGMEWDWAKVDELIQKNLSIITCIGLMGGDAYPSCIWAIAQELKAKYPQLKIGWDSGRYWTDDKELNIGKVNLPVDVRYFDYIKLGPYMKCCGGLDSPTTNQVMYKRPKVLLDNNMPIHTLDGWENITSQFWKKSYK